MVPRRTLLALLLFCNLCACLRLWHRPPTSVVVLRSLLAAVGRCRRSSRARGRAHDGRPPLCACSRRLWWPQCALGRRGATAAAAQVAELSRADGRWSLSRVSPKRRLRQQPCAQAAPSCPRGACGGSMQLAASKQGNKIFRAMSAAVYCDGPERERERARPALATSGGRKRQRRTSSAVLICEARFSRA